MKFLGNPSSGSLAGTTFSHNRAGQYQRNRRAPVQPIGTGRRAFIRSAFGAASSAWSALTSAEQASWIAYANLYPVNDSLGQSIKLTGHQMFVAVATQLQNCGQALPTDPPVSNSTAAPIVTTFTVTSAGVIVIDLTASGTADDFILVAFSAPQSAGRTFCKVFWQQVVVAGNADTVATPGTAYVEQFGDPPAGTKVFLQLTPVNQYGVTGTPVIVSAVAT
jgi:hypothetical protein